VNINRSKALFEKAQKIIPGGVNSPVRAFKSVGGNPIFIKKGKGSKIWDVDGNEYIDYIGSWGPHLFGHNPDFIINAVQETLQNGTSFGTPTELEVQMAELVCHLVPQVEMIRMVNSGTEATMSAIRLARGYTGKDKIIKFEGCYHGHADSFLIKAGSGALTFGIPTSPGVSKSSAKDTLIARYNNIESVKELIKHNKDQIACLIIEPVAGNMGVVPANIDFLTEIREICNIEKIILIFDEVMTGFRIAKGGAIELFNISSDLVTYGKIIGGGFPVGAFGGKAEIMQHISPAGPVYQAGTLSGNPVAMSAGIATLKYIKDHPDIYKILEEKSAYLQNGLNKNLKQLNLNYTVNRVGSMLCQFFTETPVNNYETAINSDVKKYAIYFHNMLKRGIYLAPAQFEAMFVSTAHTYEDLDKTINAHLDSLKEMHN